MAIDMLIKKLEIPNEYFCKRKKDQKETVTFIKQPYQVVDVLKRLLQKYSKREFSLRYGLDGGLLKQVISIQDFKREENTLYINKGTYVLELDPSSFTNFSGQLYLIPIGICITFYKKLPYAGEREMFTFIFPFEQRENRTKNNIISNEEKEK